MPYDPQRHHRRSIRLPGYDYTRAGAYFVTLVTHDRECLFGEIVGGEMRLNTWGEIAREEWFQTAVVRPYVMLRDDEFVVMPNHIHGIIWIVGDCEGNGDDDIVGAQRRCAPTCAPTAPTLRPGAPAGAPPAGGRLPLDSPPAGSAFVPGKGPGPGPRPGSAIPQPPRRPHPPPGPPRSTP